MTNAFTVILNPEWVQLWLAQISRVGYVLSATARWSWPSARPSPRLSVRGAENRLAFMAPAVPFHLLGCHLLLLDGHQPSRRTWVFLLNPWAPRPCHRSSPSVSDVSGGGHAGVREVGHRHCPSSGTTRGRRCRGRTRRRWSTCWDGARALAVPGRRSTRGRQARSSRPPGPRPPASMAVIAANLMMLAALFTSFLLGVGKLWRRRRCAMAFLFSVVSCITSLPRTQLLVALPIELPTLPPRRRWGSAAVTKRRRSRRELIGGG